jgi:hypothetical protein
LKSGFIFVSASVSRISYNRMADGIKVAADLMASAGDQGYLDHAPVQPVIVCENFVSGDRTAIVQMPVDGTRGAFRPQIAENPCPVCFFYFSTGEQPR